MLKQSGGRVDWSNDNLLVFDRLGPDDFYDVAVMNTDGSGERCLTCDKPALPNKHIGNPAWHPSGAFIVFQAQKSTATSPLGDAFFTPGAGLGNDLWIMDRDGTRFWQLTNVDVRLGGVLHAHFSHSGNQLLWSERISNRGKYGEWVIRLANFSVSAGVPRIDNVTSMQPGVQRLFYETHGFTPDDSAILFSGNLEAGLDEYAIDIYRMTLATGEVVNLTATADQWDEHGHISPSGRNIVWMSSMGSNRPTNPAQLRTDYWIMRPDGSNKTRLTFFNQPNHPHALPTGAVAGDVAWSPDGNRLVAYIIEPSPVSPGSPDSVIETRNTRVVVIDLDGVSSIDSDGPIDPDHSTADDRPDTDIAKTEPTVTESIMPLASTTSPSATHSPDQGRHPVPLALITAMPVDMLDIRSWDRHLDSLIRYGELRRTETVDETLLRGRRHERFAQFVRGVHVYGGGATRQTFDGVTTSIFVSMYDAENVDTNPRVTEAQATAVLLQSLGGVPRNLRQPDLVIAAPNSTELRLAYYWRVMSETDIRSYFVDAQTNGRIWSFSDVQTRTLESASPDEMSGNRRAGAHLLSQTVFRYFSARFNHHGLRDGLGPVNFVSPRDAPSASWAADLFRRAPFYAGDGAVFVPDGDTTLEVVAHEMAHAVVDYSSRLVNRGEAGALNEAFADVIAASVGAMVGQPENQSAGALRAPAAFGRLDHYGRRSLDTDSEDYVSRHAGISANVFHLAVEGGAHPSSGVMVTGVGTQRRAEIERIFFRAFTLLLPRSPTFLLAKSATMQAARDLYGRDSDALRAIGEAWLAAGL